MRLALRLPSEFVCEQAFLFQRIDVAQLELRAALEAFNPVWDQLTTPERARFLQNMIERIDYDGGSGKLAILFRPEGARLLGREGRPAAEVSQ